MSIKIKGYVLCKWNLYEFGAPQMFPCWDSAQKEMEQQYKKLVAEYSNLHINEDSGVYTGCAKIGTDEGCDEWQIFECEMNIANIDDLSSVFGVNLGQRKV